ncbi:MAG: hypothetical protein IPM64_07975 [Phycisphaerales bacterium]|nr:hypothetical protein [Phycisphaerales bacterium]
MVRSLWLKEVVIGPPRSLPAPGGLAAGGSNADPASIRRPAPLRERGF